MAPWSSSCVHACAKASGGAQSPTPRPKLKNIPFPCALCCRWTSVLGQRRRALLALTSTSSGRAGEGRMLRALQARSRAAAVGGQAGAPVPAGYGFAQPLATGSCRESSHSTAVVCEMQMSMAQGSPFAYRCVSENRRGGTVLGGIPVGWARVLRQDARRQTAGRARRAALELLAPRRCWLRAKTLRALWRRVGVGPRAAPNKAARAAWQRQAGARRAAAQRKAEPTGWRRAPSRPQAGAYRRPAAGPDAPEPPCAAFFHAGNKRRRAGRRYAPVVQCGERKPRRSAGPRAGPTTRAGR